MGISVYQIRWWFDMLRGKSIYHVKQGLGKIFEEGKLSGYYNDMTQKVLMGEEHLEEGLPFLLHSDGKHIQMPTMIFQYGLGAYDLWLLSEKKEKQYWDKAYRCAKWAVEHQLENGAWSNFFYVFPKSPYSAMPQGEGASLLFRIYQETGENMFLNAAKMAVDYMLTDVEKGGVCSYKGEDVILLEYTHEAAVLNGWIFAWWGLYDYVQMTENPGEYRQKLDQIEVTISKYLPQFTNSYWSMYDLSGKITSPFYHDLQIAQMKAMYRLTGRELYKVYAERWEKNKENWFYRNIAFLKKAIQKVRE